jgi:hypothetical protein
LLHLINIATIVVTASNVAQSRGCDASSMLLGDSSVFMSWMFEPIGSSYMHVPHGPLLMDHDGSDDIVPDHAVGRPDLVLRRRHNAETPPLAYC